MWLDLQFWDFWVIFPPPVDRAKDCLESRIFFYQLFLPRFAFILGPNDLTCPNFSTQLNMRTFGGLQGGTKWPKSLKTGNPATHCLESRIFFYQLFLPRFAFILGENDLTCPNFSTQIYMRTFGGLQGGTKWPKSLELSTVEWRIIWSVVFGQKQNTPFF